MLDLIRRSHRYFVGGIIVLLAGIFVAYLGLGGPGKFGGESNSLIQLGQRRYTLTDLQRVRDEQERNLRDTLGDKFDPKVAGQYLDQLAADQLIQRAVLASEAERLGLRASDEEVKDLVQRSFRGADGGYDGKLVREYAIRRFGSENRFVQEVRDDILFTKLLDLIDSGAAVSDAEVRDSIRSHLEEVKIVYVALDEKVPPAGVEADDAAVEKVLHDQSDRVHRFYDDHPDRYHLPERVHARHLLIRVAKDAPEAEVAKAKARAEAALARIRGGEEFAAVAKQVSEDPGSKDRGGDLGTVQRGQMVPAFDAVIFKLEPGKPSDVFRTDFGFHVAMVDSHEPASDKSFDDVAHDIAQELANEDRARDRAHEIADRLVDAVRSGTPLEEAAGKEGLDVKSTDWLHRRRDGYVPGLGAAPQVLTAAFAAPADHPSVGRTFDVGAKLVMIQVIDRHEPSDEDVAHQLPAERKRLLEARKNELRTEWFREARTRLAQDGQLRVDLSALRQQGAAG
jgi:peptidyl-prolyl cis-trans isomerase D